MESTSEGERIVKLALCVKAHPGISFLGIRRELPREYGWGGAERPDGGGATASDATRQDNAMRRRFERDKETLRAYGVFFLADADGGYSIDEERSYAAPVELSEGEASLLRLLCDALLADDAYPLKNEVRMILAKIGEEIEVPDMLPSMEGGASAHDAQVTGLKKVRKAIVKRKRLHFSYHDASRRASEREVEPFGCFLLNRKCYVVAFDPHAKGERVFRLDRMAHLRVNAKNPQVPDFGERPFRVSDYSGLPFQYGQEAYVAELSFDAENAWRASRLNRGWGSIEARADGGATWRVRARDSRELARWCIENGPGIVPVSPQCAREAYESGIAAALAAMEEARR